MSMMDQNASHDIKMNGSKPQIQSRDVTPDVLQRQASAPRSSVWVSASAGTGKTKVLTDRVLRLLLPISDNQAGTPPHKILCLTYTKAAASEMALRIGKTLADWAIMPENAQVAERKEEKQENLFAVLENLLGRAPHPYELSAARSLFAQVMDTPGGIRIMTIHSFCQSILGRFPLEAEIKPNQSVLDDAGAKKLLEDARKFVYSQALRENSGDTVLALRRLATNITEDQFTSLLKTLLNERNQMFSILHRHFSVEGLYTALCAALNVPAWQESYTFLSEFVPNENLPITELWQCVEALSQSKGKNDPTISAQLAQWLEMDIPARIANFEQFKIIFLTTEDEPRKKLLNNDLAKKYPHVLEALQNIQIRILHLVETLNKVQCAALTHDLFLLGEKIIKHYQHLKQKQAMLDYDDLITLTLRLLAGETLDPAPQNMPAWIHYKLDQGLDHILIDEAQDTNPEQWKIIKALTGDFFSGESSRAALKRTLFTVGDDKQSIYSFQRASPEEFSSMNAYYDNQLSSAGDSLENIPLRTSFRSAPSVLEAVDLVFSLPELTIDPGFRDVHHISYRNGQAGMTQLWPLFAAEKADQEPDPWEPPIIQTSAKSASSICAAHIAEQISSWLESKEKLESHDRPIEPGDIMILVRTRTAFVNQLIRELKNKKIPVAGHDRMVLNNQLAVQDMLALAEFALLPADDLTLACLLKSPLIGLNEDDLYTLSIDRAPHSLWERLSNDIRYTHIADYLKDFISRAGGLRPYEFLNFALSQPCPAQERSGMSAMKSRLGHDCIDPLDELLGAALRYEEDNIPTLQGFVRWQKSGSFEIKRELEEAGGQVRIMTIHGSKGLQAPIVIMPDTVRLRKKNAQDAGANLLWPQKTGFDLPLWSPRKELNYDLYTQAETIIDHKMEQEYRRLLYVAMTRAEDRLYITGYKGKNDIPEDCWYNYIKRGLLSKNGIMPDEHGYITLANPQIKDHDRKARKTSDTDKIVEPPEWLNLQAPEEPKPPHPLIPSRPSGQEPAALSPLQGDRHSRFRRGNITHKLLQFLPDIAPDLREKSAEQFLSRFAHDLKPEIRSNILAEVMAILNHPEFAPLFASGSRAEVPITGLIHGVELVSGQIDRLAIGEKDIWIVDYKTNRPPPDRSENVPQIYRNQLRTYRDTLALIYPAHRIHCALLWTDGPVLMPIDL